MIPYYPGRLYSAGESAVGQKELNVAAVYSPAEELREQPRGREAEKLAASQMTDTAEAAHTGQGVSALQAHNSLKGMATGSQGL